ncbi:PHD finger protein 21B-like, partial [Antrostomus carolinensis]|uniref:PHD finger protein 21B-like n=1 Tax=Antrostomus carolinensis TaxID=279965 RepID=UPI000528BF0E
MLVALAREFAEAQTMKTAVPPLDHTVAGNTRLMFLCRTGWVRPKTLIPDSLPISPCRDQPSKQPPTFQKATVVSIKNPSPALPTANNTVSHVQTPNSQSQSVTESTAISSPLSSAGVAYAIISTSPNNATPISTSATVSVVNDSIKVQPLLISADNKVIIIQPQVQTQTESKVETKKPPEESAQGPPATKKKKEENPENILATFFVAKNVVPAVYAGGLGKHNFL